MIASAELLWVIGCKPNVVCIQCNATCIVYRFLCQVELKLKRNCQHLVLEWKVFMSSWVETEMEMSTFGARVKSFYVKLSWNWNGDVNIWCSSEKFFMSSWVETGTELSTFGARVKSFLCQVELKLKQSCQHLVLEWKVFYAKLKLKWSYQHLVLEWKEGWHAHLLSIWLWKMSLPIRKINCAIDIIIIRIHVLL
jgi:hypothetical protein